MEAARCPIRAIDAKAYALSGIPPGFSFAYDRECLYALGLPQKSTSVYAHRPIPIEDPKIPRMTFSPMPDKMMDMTQHMHHGAKHISDTARGLVTIAVGAGLYLHRMKTLEYGDSTHQLLDLNSELDPINCVAVSQHTYNVSYAIDTCCYIMDQNSPHAVYVHNVDEKIEYITWKDASLYIATTSQLFMYDTRSRNMTRLYQSNARIQHLDCTDNAFAVLTDSSLMNIDARMYLSKWDIPIKAECVYTDPTSSTVYTGGKSSVKVWDCNGNQQAELALDSSVLAFGMLRGSLFCGTRQKIHCLHTCKSGLYLRASVDLCSSTEEVPNYAYGMKIRGRHIVAHTRREEVRIWDAVHFEMGDKTCKKRERYWESKLSSTGIR